MPASPPRNQIRRAALAGAFVDLFGGGQDAPPKEFRIFGRGLNSSSKGDFLFDDEAAAMVMAAARRHGVDFTIDYDHHTLFTSQGVKAVSAGWFKVALKDGELWATDVKWTPDALEHLAKKEYRYFSPLFDWDSKSGKITNLINNALTNTPALHELDALVAASSTTDTEGDVMDPELKKALDRITELERQSTAKDERIRSLEGQGQMVALSTVIGLAGTAGAEEVRSRVAALSVFQRDVIALSGKDSPEKAIAALSTFKEQAAEVATVRQKAEDMQTAALSTSWKSYLDILTTNGQDGKTLPPAKREKAESMALSLGGGKLTEKGIEAAKLYVVEMLVTAPGANDGHRAGGNTVALSGVTPQVLKQMSIGQEAFLKDQASRTAGGIPSARDQ